MAVAEDLVSNRLSRHFQSGFRPGFGTEMTLIILMDDLWWEQDDSTTRMIVHPSWLYLTSQQHSIH